MARRALGEKQHGVFLAHGIGVEDLAGRVRARKKTAIRILRALLRRRRSSRGRCRGRWRRSGPAGREPKSSRMRPTPDSTMRLTVPRQPAWKAATTRRLRSATRTGMQSAVCTARSRPGSSVIWPSALRGRGTGCVGADGVDDAVGMELMESDQRGFGSPVTASARRRRLRLTVARLSASVKPRFNSPARRAAVAFGAIGAAEAAFARGESGPEPGKIPARDGQPFDAVGRAARDGRGRGQFFGVCTVESRVGA